MPDLSRSELDRLGDRLRAAVEPDDADRLAYEEYRESFGPALSAVINRATAVLSEVLDHAARFKTLESTVAKLRRGSARLSQIQDIAGLRIVIPTTPEQDEAIAALSAAFPNARITDYRDEPQHGYRAVHIITQRTLGHGVEIQVRTRFQNMWASVSERAAFDAGMDVKYGGGPAPVRESLDSLSRLLASMDEATTTFQQMGTPPTRNRGRADRASFIREMRKALVEFRANTEAMEREVDELMRILEAMNGSPR